MQKQPYNGPLERIDPYCVRIPKSYKPGMRVPGLIYVNDNLLEQVKKDQAPDPAEGGVICPGGIGYDINCGVRLLRTNLGYRQVKNHIRKLVQALFNTV